MKEKTARLCSIDHTSIADYTCSMTLFISFPSWISPQIFPSLPLRWYGLMYVVAFSIAYRITSYNVCYTKLLRLGATCSINEEGEIHIKADHARLSGNDIFLDEASVTATENVIMAASLAQGTSILRNAASEP